jgi:hypothetical protein
MVPGTSTHLLQRHYADVFVIVPGSEVVLRCSIAGRCSSDQPSVVVKLELMRSLAENSRKRNVVFRHLNPKVDLSAIPRRSLLSSLFSLCKVPITIRYLVAGFSIGVSRVPRLLQWIVGVEGLARRAHVVRFQLEGEK